ncbi:MAG: glucose-6-phosphate isomerase family protein [Candidatus Daviesbacteria bacterium]|nr:glucose-6-phosphate isomerase family protein [Candidatus Daviesbacteria bacterium]
MIKLKTHKDLRPVLMEKVNNGVKTPYYILADNDQVIFVISQGFNGGEFNKTSGYFNNFPGVQTYQCLYGSGILLMQRNDESEEAKEFKMVRLNPYRQVNVPASWFVCLVNTGNSFLIVLKNSYLDEKYKVPKSISDKRGFAYYVVDKRGEIAFEPNPYYRVHPQITTE